ncbi:hypothetical protein F5Y19DRAFT_430811 [Xylariaceae sp. FL1651]|nr:hypothetical protein F5Y19DRAFT_430811 [Xylariaceae sp. FL1651]
MATNITFDIVTLMMKHLNGRDEELVSDSAFYPRVLQFDRVMEGRPRSRKCRLLTLPAEILDYIFDYFVHDSSTLAINARHHSSCQYGFQTARPRSPICPCQL